MSTGWTSIFTAFLSFFALVLSFFLLKPKNDSETFKNLAESIRLLSNEYTECTVALRLLREQVIGLREYLYLHIWVNLSVEERGQLEKFFSCMKIV